jgi:hypothetical protein
VTAVEGAPGINGNTAAIAPKFSDRIRNENSGWPIVTPITLGGAILRAEKAQLVQAATLERPEFLQGERLQAWQ